MNDEKKYDEKILSIVLTVLSAVIADIISAAISAVISAVISIARKVPVVAYTALTEAFVIFMRASAVSMIAFMGSSIAPIVVSVVFIVVFVMFVLHIFFNSDRLSLRKWLLSVLKKHRRYYQPIAIIVCTALMVVMLFSAYIGDDRIPDNPMNTVGKVDSVKSINIKVRKLGGKDWGEVIKAEVGDLVEIQMEYNNISTEQKDDAMIRNVLPGNLKYVDGTTKLYNANHPNWATVSPDGDIMSRGINIGSYLGSEDGQNGGNAFIRFTAEVVNTDLACGENFIYNWGQASVDGTLSECSACIIVQG